MNGIGINILTGNKKQLSQWLQGVRRVMLWFSATNLEDGTKGTVANFADDTNLDRKVSDKADIHKITQRYCWIK